MVEVLREVPRDALPFFVRDVLGDGCEGFVKRWRGGGAQHRDRTFIVLDHNFVTSAHMIQTFKHQPGGDLGGFFRLDFVEASAIDAAFRHQLAGLNPF